MPIKYIPYYPETVQGQAILNNFTRTQRALKYRDNDQPAQRILRGLPLYEVETLEIAGKNPDNNLLIRGECLAACAYLKSKGIEVDLVYIDPPFASGADYAKTISLRRNPKVAEAIAIAEEELDGDALQAFEEKMYGDIWNKEAYLNWMYENLAAIKSVMSAASSIYVHLDYHIGHYVKVMMDEIFGESHFRNEIVWYYGQRTAPREKRFDMKHDTLFFYARSEDTKLNQTSMPWSYEEFVQHRHDIMKESNGREYVLSDATNGERYVRYVDDIIAAGKPVDSVWNIPLLNSSDKQRVDYATQKPEELLRRIIEASSEKDMIIADFFGGSGVAAKVAHDLGRKFIHADIGLNSIQTTRDRLIAAGASFDILEIKDGVALFRNPAQTMDKLKSLIPGMGAASGLSDFWAGAIHASKEGLTPVYLPNLLDHTQKLLDIPLMNRIVQEELPDLPDGVKKAIIYYIDVEDLTALEKFIADVNATEIKVELRDLKQLLHDVVVNDLVEYQLTETQGQYTIEFTRLVSDRLMQKIDAYNQKKELNHQKNGQIKLEEADDQNGENGEDEENGETAKPARSFKPIQISENGLELIELVSLDCTNTEGLWHSDTEIKIDKKGYLILNGVKTKTFWDAKITCEKKPLRLKVRNIAGDETILQVEAGHS